MNVELSVMKVFLNWVFFKSRYWDKDFGVDSWFGLWCKNVLVREGVNWDRKRSVVKMGIIIVDNRGLF